RHENVFIFGAGQQNECQLLSSEVVCGNGGLVVGQGSGIDWPGQRVLVENVPERIEGVVAPEGEILERAGDNRRQLFVGAAAAEEGEPRLQACGIGRPVQVVLVEALHLVSLILIGSILLDGQHDYGTRLPLVEMADPEGQSRLLDGPVQQIEIDLGYKS